MYGFRDECVAAFRAVPARSSLRDEWYYVVSGEFLFKAGGEDHNLSTGGSIWLPRGIPHVWANTATTDGKLSSCASPAGLKNSLRRSAKRRWIRRVPKPCEILWRNTEWKCWDLRSLRPPGCSNINPSPLGSRTPALSLTVPPGKAPKPRSFEVERRRQTQCSWSASGGFRLRRRESRVRVR